MSVELPKLPNKAKLYTAMPDDYRYGHVYGYTADHMREHGRAVERAAYERAAALCGSPYSDETDDPYECGFNRAAEVIADAIRALKSEGA